MRRLPAGRTSSPVPLSFCPTLRATQLSPELPHGIPTRPSEILIPFAHPPCTPPSCPYHPPFHDLDSEKIHRFESPLPGGPQGSFEKAPCRPPPRACSRVAHGSSESPTGHRKHVWPRKMPPVNPGLPKLTSPTRPAAARDPCWTASTLFPGKGL